MLGTFEGAADEGREGLANKGLLKRASKTTTIAEIRAVLCIAGDYPPAFIMPFGSTAGNQHRSDFIVGFRPTTLREQESFWNAPSSLPEQRM